VFRRKLESRDFAFALSLTFLAVAGLVAYDHWIAPHSSAAVQHQPGPDGVAESSLRASSRVRSVAKEDSLPVIARVYECNGAGGHVLSDRPCSKDAQVREVIAPNRMPAVSATDNSRAAVRTGSRVASVQKSSAEPIAPQNDQLCASIEAAIDKINARMRHKYTSFEGENFRQRLRELEDQRWEAKCRLRS
jgi:hypothetical protein